MEARGGRAMTAKVKGLVRSVAAVAEAAAEGGVLVVVEAMVEDTRVAPVAAATREAVGG